MIYLGDLFDVLPTLDAELIDACITDPPYGIGFMTKKWDTFAPDEASKRVVVNQQIDSDNPNLRGRARSPASSPSAVGYNRSLDGQHEFQVWTERWAREVLRVLKPGAYLVICGAPRSFHRMTCGVEDAGFEIRDCLSWLYGQGFPKSLNVGGGRGTALKPSWEPCVLARKPFNDTLVNNLAVHNTGALNISACRLGDHDDRCGYALYGPPAVCTCDGQGCGRWPANVVLDEAVARSLDEQAGRSRFYYVAKPSRAERDRGCDDLPERTGGEVCEDRVEGSAGLNNPRAGAGRTGGARNFHPTVKPIALMRWLVRLVTPPEPTAIVLDPFMGSGTTGMACRFEQREFIGIEREADYAQIAERRIAATLPLFGDNDNVEGL